MAESQFTTANELSSKQAGLLSKIVDLKWEVRELLEERSQERLVSALTVLENNTISAHTIEQLDKIAQTVKSLAEQHEAKKVSQFSSFFAPPLIAKASDVGEKLFKLVPSTPSP